MFTIKSGVPIPEPSVRFPFNQMDVGSSFDISSDALRQKAVPAAHTYGRKNGMKFRTKTTGGVTTIWRVA